MRQIERLAVIALLAAMAPLRAAAQTPTLEDRTDAALASALAFLSRQQREDGSFGQRGPQIAETSLALLSFLACGHTQDVGRYGLVVRRAVDYLAKAAPEDGDLGKSDGSGMLGQGLATLALAEAYGVEPDPEQRARIRAAVERAVAVILKAQNMPRPQAQAGGWGSRGQSTESDLIVSGWYILALRSASAIGLSVPPDHLDRATMYVLNCCRADPAAGSAEPSKRQRSPAADATGVLLLCLLDNPDRAEVRAAAKALVGQKLSDRTPHPYYTMYSMAQAASQLQGADGAAIWAAVRDRLLSQQSPDGGWPGGRSSEEEAGRTYATGLAVLALSAPERTLPAYRR